ncbi:type-2 ice-structuring protein-like [Pseudorasbora parva]|uniref:type-2 ice-structuring protein-like n=1 Tax=Pseudorasbora parva TaxID=51549 RepID=UPI00351DFA23
MEMLRTFLLLFVIFSMGNAGKECPCGWAKFGVRCYKFFPETVNWVTAQRNCQRFGANLVSVHSRAENDFLLSLLPSLSTRAWIGAHDGEIEGQWLWNDGTEPDFTSWCVTEPNNQNVENCLEICWTAKNCWNDESCSTLMASICATDL